MYLTHSDGTGVGPFLSISTKVSMETSPNFVGEALHISKACVGCFCLCDNLCSFYSIKWCLWSMRFNFCLSSHLLSRPKYLCLSEGLSPLGTRDSLSHLSQPELPLPYVPAEKLVGAGSWHRAPLLQSHFMPPDLVSCSPIFKGVDKLRLLPVPLLTQQVNNKLSSGTFQALHRCHLF